MGWSKGGVTESQVNSIVNSYGEWELEESFTSIVQQDAVEDVLTPVDFGDTKTSPNGLMLYNDTEKRFEILKEGAFMAKTRCRAARIGGSAGESELFLQAQISLDEGVNWVNTGDSVDVKLDDNKQVEIFFDFSPLTLPKGALIRQVFARSSSGTDFGSLVAGTPSAALIALGIDPSPAAQVNIYKLKDFNYV